MKTEFIKQYEHTWRVFARLVNDFQPEAWLHTGRGAITPARLSYHMLQSAKYYMQVDVPPVFQSGKPFDCNWVTAAEDALPSQTDVLAYIEEFKVVTAQWIDALDLEAENKDFPWAGKIKMGVVLFVLRHQLFHTGELSSLLNESKQGEVEDHYVKALEGM